ncbi:MAG TPA: hypothetical protein VF503_21130 [Sphingobium sp.]|uniref:hypothetical protein n=1 Tax=Sphingobium sp. TaxID=1912891 RepID=UPI002ED53666
MKHGFTLGGRAPDDCAYEAQDEYEGCCGGMGLPVAACTDNQAAFAARLKELDEYQATNTYDDVRFERHVRTYLWKLARLTKANEGFEKILRHQ